MIWNFDKVIFIAVKLCQSYKSNEKPKFIMLISDFIGRVRRLLFSQTAHRAHGTRFFVPQEATQKEFRQMPSSLTRHEIR